MGPSADRRLGQVLEASTRGFIAQAKELHQPPDLGSLVRVEGPPARSRQGGTTIYAVVTGSKTESLEGRLPIATGWGLADGAAVLREEPHLPKLLRTSFEGVAVAYDLGDGIRIGLAPSPGVLYGFVEASAEEEAQALAASLDFLPLLLAGAPVGVAEEAAAACLRRLAQDQADPEAFKLRAGKRLAVLLSNEPVRLASALRRLAS